MNIFTFDLTCDIISCAEANEFGSSDCFPALLLKPFELGKSAQRFWSRHLPRLLWPSSADGSLTECGLTLLVAGAAIYDPLDISRCNGPIFKIETAFDSTQRDPHFF